MRDSLFPPPRFFFFPDPATVPAARRVHQICNRAVWRSLGPLGKLYGAALTLAWPVTDGAVALHWLKRNGAAVKALTGKSAIRQFFEIVGLGMRHHISPKYYFMFEFYLDDRMRQAGNYLMRYETKQVAYRLLKPEVETTGTPIKNKIAFAGYCRKHDLPAVPLVAAFRNGARVPEIGDGAPPPCDLFVKRVLGKGGAGAERWNWIGNGRYRGNQGEERSGAEVLEHVAVL